MTFLEALQIDTDRDTAQRFIDRLADIPSSLSGLANRIITSYEDTMELMNTAHERFEEIPTYQEFVPVTREEKLQQARENVIELLTMEVNDVLDRLDRSTTILWRRLERLTQPLPLEGSADLNEMKLANAKTDAREALSIYDDATILHGVAKLQQEALDNGEYALAQLLASPWLGRYLKANHKEVMGFEKLEDDLLDRISDPKAKPYRKAKQQLEGITNLRMMLEHEFKYRLSFDFSPDLTSQ